MVDTGAGDSSFDISDPSDWLNTPLAPFSQIEAGLRCQVCKDFYTTPMITSCAHTFCSLCIRHCYSSDKKCPACRASGQETQLRRNGVVEELVEAFQKARKVALDFARKPSAKTRSASPKRKLDPVVEHETDGDRPSKRTRSSSKRTELAEQSRNSVSSRDDEADGEYHPEVQSTRSDSTSKKSSFQDPDLVQCPICEAFVKGAKINSHLDNNCYIPPKPASTLVPEVSRSSRPSRQSTTKPLPTQTPLPFLAYNSMKEPALRKKLTELGIPVWGTKIEMQKRHTEWVTIYNSNCDAKNPRPMNKLLSDLDTWERTQGASAPKSSSNLSMGLSIKDENFDGHGWARKHHDDFSDLIAKAKEKRTAPKATASSSTELPTPIPSSAAVATDNDDAARMLNSHPIIEADNDSTRRTESSTKENTSTEKPAELPIITTIKQDAIEPPFPSSQISHLKTSDNPNPPSSQFTPSPRTKRFFEDAEDPIVDHDTGITSHQ